MNLYEIIYQALSKYDSADELVISEHDISSDINAAIPKGSVVTDERILGELMAFDFCENYTHKNGWGTYFGPMMVWNNGDGTATESPSIQRITPAIIDYWEQRAKAAQNPILKARYAGLVWDFKKRITSIGPSFEIGKTYIESLIDIASKKNHKYEVDTIDKLRRALFIAVSFKQSELIEKCKREIINYESHIAIDDKPGLWGFSFDLLIDNKQILIESELEESIIQELHAKLERLTDNANIDPWAAEAAAKRLAQYYKKRNKKEEAKEVLLRVGEAFQASARELRPFQASGILEHLYSLYTEYGLDEEANALLLQLRELGPKINEGLGRISHTFEISQEEMKMFVDAVLGGELEDVLKNLAIFFIPSKRKSKDQLLEIASKAPLQYMIKHQILDYKGRVVSVLRSIDDDLEGHIVKFISQVFAYNSPFLRNGIAGIIEKFELDANKTINYIKQSPVVAEERLPIIEKGLQAYFAGDYISWMHLIIPQIEEAVRNIIERSHGNVLRPSRSGGFNLRVLDDLLRDDIVIQSLGEDFSLYFRVLFTDQRSWNLRNNICHGTIGMNFFHYQHADRVFHALLCLGLIYDPNTQVAN